MSPKERFLSEQIAWIGWRIPGLSHTLKRNFHDSITRRKREKLEALEEQVLQKLKTLQSGENTKEAPGFRGAIIGFIERLVGENGRRYECTVVTDIQRLEVEVVDVPQSEYDRIRKYRVFLGRYQVNGETVTCDLSSIGDLPFSWRRNSYDDDKYDKRLTLKESYQFMEEIIQARPESSHPSLPVTLFGN